MGSILPILYSLKEQFHEECHIYLHFPTCISDKWEEAIVHLDVALREFLDLA